MKWKLTKRQAGKQAGMMGGYAPVGCLEVLFIQPLGVSKTPSPSNLFLGGLTFNANIRSYGVPPYFTSILLTLSPSAHTYFFPRIQEDRQTGCM